MNREDAFYYESLLVIGFSDEYDEWLDSCIESENPLSNITHMSPERWKKGKSFPL